MKHKNRIIESPPNETELSVSTSSSTQLEARFAEAQARLHPRRRLIIRGVLDHPEDTYFLSSTGLAKHFGVDAATIVRTVQDLGYQSFGDFAVDLRRHFVARITPYTLLQAATREIQPGENSLARSIDKDMANLHSLRTSLDFAQVMGLAKSIHRARHILVVGVDIAYSAAYFLSYGLFTAGFQAETPMGSEGVLYHKVKGLASKDLLIAISFGRCLKETVEAVKQARQQGVPTFGITNSDVTPIAKYCDRYVLANIASSAFTGSYVAPMAVINTIIVACSLLHPEHTLARLLENEKEYTIGARWYRDETNGRKAKSIGAPSRRAKKYHE
ncbi:MAG: MurR/RpiR family transcriptional regulator [Acidobacteria bacterium]|nr:MurR/RpiR family transcriptional regulator [Acidobacteriota bacterium]